MQKGLVIAGTSIAAGSSKAAAAISQKTSQWSASLKEKKVGEKFTALFTRKKKNTLAEADAGLEDKADAEGIVVAEAEEVKQQESTM